MDLPPNLRSPDTWCAAAEELARAGDPAAIVPLLHAYELDVEGSRLCLLQAMRALDGVAEASRLYERGGAGERRLAAHLMELLADDAHLSALEHAVADDDAAVRAQARTAFRTQRRTAAWEALATRLLESTDQDARAEAERALAEHRAS